METQTFSDDMRRYAGLAWHWAWLLILAGVLAAVSAYAVSRSATPVYQAATTLLVNQAPVTRDTDYNAVLTSERLARTYSEMLTKQPVLAGVVVRLGLAVKPVDLKDAITVRLVRDTQLIVVNVEDVDPARAAEIANALVGEFAAQNQALQASRYAASKESLEAQLGQMDAQIAQVNQSLLTIPPESTRLEDQSERDRLEANLAQYRQVYASLLQSYEQVRLAEAGSTSNVVQVEPAVIPERPIRPRTLINTLLAGVVGLLLAIGVVFLIEALDDTLSPADVTGKLGLPVLGVIASHNTKKNRLMVVEEPRSPIAEAFRSLRTNLQFASVDTPLHTLLITSPSPEDGKSTVAANLACCMAQGGKRVTLIDADLHRPVIHRMMGLSNNEGITSLFTGGSVNLNGHLKKTQLPELTAITSGALPPNPAELLGSEKMLHILEVVQSISDQIVLDTPPVLAVTDAAVVASRVDGVLLVIKPGTTRLTACQQAIEQLRRVEANLLGVVLNDVQLKRSSYKYRYYKGYGYSYYYSHPSKKTSRPAEPIYTHPLPKD